MDNLRIEQSKILFQAYLEMYLIYNRSQVPAKLAVTHLLCRPMLMAFVCELGLKALVLQNGMEYKRVHLLNELFELVNSENQQFIIEVLKMEEAQFKAMISKNANIFVEWRYFTEHQPCAADTKFIEDLINIIARLLMGHSYIDELSALFMRQQ